MERNKKIYFCIDWLSYSRFLGKAKSKYEPVGNAVCCPYYTNTEKAIVEEGKECIVTTSMAHFSFSLRDLGYKIYLCYKDKEVEIKPHMDLTGIGEPCKVIRTGHNILRLFRAGVFNKLLGIE